MTLVVHHLSKTFGINIVLDDLSFSVGAGERVGVVGMNGVGKSTLLNILSGQEPLDAGTVALAAGAEMAYLPQATPAFFGRTIDDLILESVGNLRQLEARMRQLEAQMAGADEAAMPTLLEEYAQASTRFQDRGGYDLDYRIDAILAGLGIAHLPRTREVQTLSGGEKARVGLATLLLRSPDVLLLDEPTNHLDVAALEWLEGYLAAYSGALLAVSHDRQFLNRVVNRIFEIDERSHHLKKYEGNYDTFAAAKAAERAKWEEDYERQQEEIKDLRLRMRETGRQVAHNRAPKDGDKYIYNFKGGGVQKAISRNVRAAEEQLKRIEADPIAKPPKPLRFYPRFDAKPLRSDSVISVEHVSKSHAGRVILRDLSFRVASDARIVLVGPNGVGKTTLLRLLLGLDTPDAGSVRVTGSARLGYLPQEPLVDPNQTILAAYRQVAPGYDEQVIAGLLERGLFRLEDMPKLVGQLSVGQRRKLEIARLMARQPNALLLDEPTNYISLDVLEAFEAAVLAFPGPVIVASHDRWFMQRFGGERWELADGRLVGMDSYSASSRG
ncbi:MAG TPA: ABC-F family ATP-binding cassette domain-containing protein [Ktedonobacterales bacterium]|jgi:macrolide transport system ATP-binding/permease protein